VTIGPGGWVKLSIKQACFVEPGERQAHRLY
jgi:hypothetical protein